MTPHPFDAPYDPRSIAPDELSKLESSLASDGALLRAFAPGAPGERFLRPFRLSAPKRARAQAQADLWSALYDSDATGAQRALDLGADWGLPNELGFTPETVARLMEESAISDLFEALAAREQADGLAALDALTQSAALDDEEERLSPLDQRVYSAAATKNLGALRSALAAGGDPNAPAPSWMLDFPSPLLRACSSESLNPCSDRESYYSWQEDASIHRCESEWTGEYNSPDERLLSERRSFQCASILLEYGANPRCALALSRLPTHDIAPLHFALVSQRPDLENLLLSYGAPPPSARESNALLRRALAQPLRAHDSSQAFIACVERLIRFGARMDSALGEGPALWRGATDSSHPDREKVNATLESLAIAEACAPDPARPQPIPCASRPRPRL